jgi:DNA polymerase III subunit delta
MGCGASPTRRSGPRAHGAAGGDRGHLKLTTDSLAKHLAERLLPAYLICGDEPLLCGEAADAVRTRARAAGFTEREVHFIERAGDWDEVRASAASLSLFGARRMLEIRLGTSRPGSAGNAALVALLTARDPDTLLLILTPRLDREAQGAEWVRAADAHGAWVQIWPVDRAELVAWLRNRCRALGLEAEGEALALLAWRTEGNLLAAQQELTKLTLLAASRNVTTDAVLASVADSARFDVYQLGEAVLAGDAPRSLRMLAGLHAEGVEATLVLWALVRSLRDVWNARAGAPPAPAWQRRSAALAQAARRASRLSFAGLAQRAERADRMIKGRLAGSAWDEMALLAAEICAVPSLRAPAAPQARVS